MMTRKNNPDMKAFNTDCFGMIVSFDSPLTRTVQLTAVAIDQRKRRAIPRMSGQLLRLPLNSLVADKDVSAKLPVLPRQLPATAPLKTTGGRSAGSDCGNIP